MYHIPNNKKSQYSAKLITQTLLDILQNNSLEEINIVTLCQHAQIGRTTFYRNFDNITDILQYYCDNLCVNLPHYIHQHSQNDQFLIYANAFFEFWDKHTNFLEVLLKNNQGIILQNSFNNLNFCTDSTYSKTIDICNKQMAYIILTSWITSGKTETPQQLVEALTNCLLKNSN